MENLTILYRAEYACYVNSNTLIYFYSYPVVKYTNKGVWIKVDTDKKFVLLSGKKRFAYPTKEEALYSLKCRKERQLKIIENTKRVANDIINQINTKDINEYSSYST